MKRREIKTEGERRIRASLICKGASADDLADIWGVGREAVYAKLRKPNTIRLRELARYAEEFSLTDCEIAEIVRAMGQEAVNNE